MDGVSVFSIYNSEKEIDREKSEDDAWSNERAKQIFEFHRRCTKSS